MTLKSTKFFQKINLNGQQREQNSLRERLCKSNYQKEAILLQ